MSWLPFASWFGSGSKPAAPATASATASAATPAKAGAGNSVTYSQLSASGVLNPEPGAVAASVDTTQTLQRSPRIERLHRILGNEVLNLPDPPAAGTAFSSKIIDRLGVEDAAAASISKSYQLAAAESRVAYVEAQGNVARGALLPQVKLVMKGGKENTSPGGDTYKFCKEAVCTAANGRTYARGEMVPNSSLLNGGVPNDNLTAATFAMDNITLNRTDKMLTVSQSLFDYGAWSELSRQRKMAQSAEHVARGARLKAVLNASQSYLKLFQNSLAARFAEDYETALQGLYERMEARVKGGAGSQADLERIKGRRVNARSTVLDARNALEVELTAFQKITGFRPKSLVLPPDWITAVPESVNGALSAATENNPALQADLKMAESILLEMRKSKGSFMPQVSLEMSQMLTKGASGSKVPVVTSQGVDVNTLGEEAPTYLGQAQHLQKRIQSLMVVMNWSLFSGGQDFYQHRAIGEKYNEAMFNLLDTRRELEEKIRASFESLATTAARSQEIAKEMDANQQVVEAFTAQMFDANRSLLDVLDAHQKLYQSRLDYLRLLIAEANLAYDVLHNIGTLTEALRVPDSAQSPRGQMGSLVGKEIWRK